MRRSLLILAIAGLVGLAIGLYVGWVQFPVQTVKAPMPVLSPADKLNYVIMVAESYQLSGNLTEATRQIAQLGVPEVGSYVRQLTENLITTAGLSQAVQVRAMARLAVALGQGTTLMQPYTIASAPPPIATAS